MPHEANESRRHKIPKAGYGVENWAAYDAALRRWENLTIWVTPEAIAAWTPPATGRCGRPSRYSDLAIEAGLMLRLAFGRPWRQTEGLLGSLMRLLGLDLPVPDHTTFSRRCIDLAVASALARTDGPVTVIIDSTGLKVFGRGEWHLEKHSGTARRCWRKLHLDVDPATGETLASALTGNEEGDASLVGPLLDQVTGPIGSVLADGTYDGEPVYRAVAERAPDAEVIIPPRSTALGSDTAESASTRRDHHIQTIKERGRRGWQRAVQYGRRSLVEVAMLRYKVLIGRSLRARTLPAQKVEAAVGCKVMNVMTSLGMPTTRKVALARKLATVNRGGMAQREGVRQAKFSLLAREIVDHDDARVEALGLHPLHPGAAATAGSVPLDPQLRDAGGSSGQRLYGDRYGDAGSGESEGSTKEAAAFDLDHGAPAEWVVSVAGRLNRQG